MGDGQMGQYIHTYDLYELIYVCTTSTSIDQILHIRCLGVRCIYCKQKPPIQPCFESFLCQTAAPPIKPSVTG